MGDQMNVATLPKRNEFNDAVVHIENIARGTANAQQAILKAAASIFATGCDTAWHSLMAELHTLYAARDTDEAWAAIDECHIALTHLRERDYDGEEYRHDC